MAEQHVDRLPPAREALGVPLPMVLLDPRSELCAWKVAKMLTEETGDNCHLGAASRMQQNEFFSKLLLPRFGRGRIRPMAILDKSDEPR